MSSNDTDPRERLEDSLKTPFPEGGEIWSAFLAALEHEFNDLEDELDKIETAKFVTTATGEQLDKLGSIFQLERRTGESDNRYRIRLQTELRALISSGTLDEVKASVAVLLDVDEGEVVIREPFDVEPARIDLGVFESELEERGIEVEEFDEFVDGLIAGGVAVETFALGTFMHVSVDDDPTVEGAERGYASLDNPDEGGTYASVDLSD